MARNKQDADALLAHLDAKGITYTVTKARHDWSEYDEPPRKKGKRVKLVPDLELAKRIAERGEPCDIFVVMQAKTQGMNAREHWAKKAKRIKAEHLELEALLSAHTSKRATLAAGCIVTMCRIGRKLDEDNLYGHMKGIRDYIAYWLLGGRMGERDSDPRIVWRYEQASIGKSFGVTVSIKNQLTDT